MTTTVKFELAKLLREKGFWGVFNLYSIETKKIWTTCYLGEDEFEKNYPAPTIAEVVMWLYETHKIWIKAEPTIKDKWESFVYQTGWNYINTFNSPTEAYEAAIEHVLTHLI